MIWLCDTLYGVFILSATLDCAGWKKGGLQTEFIIINKVIQNSKSSREMWYKIFKNKKNKKNTPGYRLCPGSGSRDKMFEIWEKSKLPPELTLEKEKSFQ